VIGTSHREDNQTLRVIVGNDAAVKAARMGKTNPWPEGSILAKLVWKDEIHPKWTKATVPGEFVHAEFMIKDSAKYQETGGWGFARWIGMNQAPYGKDNTFIQECQACHVQVKDNDFRFYSSCAPTLAYVPLRFWMSSGCVCLNAPKLEI